MGSTKSTYIMRQDKVITRMFLAAILNRKVWEGFAYSDHTMRTARGIHVSASEDEVIEAYGPSYR